MLMPFLIGMTLIKAVEKLKELEFEDLSFFNQDGGPIELPGNENREVISTQPEAGDEMTPTTPISLTVHI